MNSVFRFLATTFAVIALLGLPAAAMAAQADTIQFQGFLTDEVGVPVVGEKNITVSIYDAADGGTVLWSDVQTLMVSNGQFSMALGGGSTELDKSIFDGRDLWIGVRVDADEEMSPRHPVASVPYAILARNAEWADRCGSADSAAWGSLTSIPSGFADGTDDVLSQAEVLAMVTDGGFITADALSAYSTTAQLTATLDGYALVDHGHVWADISDVPAACSPGQILKHGVAGWECGEDLSNSYDGADFALSAQACGGSQKMTGIDMNGWIICDEDVDTDSTYDGTDFVVSSQMCSIGYLVRGFDSNGQAVCTPDMDTVYTGANFAKSNQTCPDGSVVSAIDASGNITCKAVGGGSALADPVYGSGESGVLSISTPTVWTVSDTARLTAQYSQITVSSSLSVPSGTMLRCSGNFTVTAAGSITVRSGYETVTGDRSFVTPALALTGPGITNGTLSIKLPATAAAQMMRAPALSGTNGYVATGVNDGSFGGGGLTIRAKGIVSIAGSVVADGSAGAVGVQGGGGGGGSGGFIIIMSQTSISNTGAIAARGGAGGAATQSSSGLMRAGGAGGGGGIVHIIAPAITAGTVYLNGGSPGADIAGGASGVDGRGGGGLGGNGGNPGLDGAGSGPGEIGILIQTVTTHPENLVL